MLRRRDDGAHLSDGHGQEIMKAMLASSEIRCSLSDASSSFVDNPTIIPHLRPSIYRKECLVLSAFHILRCIYNLHIYYTHLASTDLQHTIFLL